MERLRRAVKTLNKIEDSIVISCVAIALALCLIQVAFRYVFNYPLSWPEELGSWMLILMVYVGISVALRRRDHIVVDVIPTFFPRSEKFLHYVSIVSGIFFSLLILIYGIEFVRSQIASGQVSVTLKFPIFIVYSILPMGGALLLLHYILEIMGLNPRKPT